jgi:hypothetical protein
MDRRVGVTDRVTVYVSQEASMEPRAVRGFLESLCSVHERVFFLKPAHGRVEAMFRPGLVGKMQL